MADENMEVKEKLPEGNSLKERAARKEETKVTRVVSEKMRKDSFLDKAEDFMDPIINDVMIPSAQSMIMNVVNSVLTGIGDGICEAITGKPMRNEINIRTSVGGSRRTDYSARSRRTSTSRSSNVRDNRERVTESYKLRDLSVDNHEDAVNVMDQLWQICESYDHVSVNDLYGLDEISKSCPYTYNNYGWYDLGPNNSGIINNGDGTWGFDLPKPVPLNR